MNENGIRGRRIMLFDGVCNLCNESVIFILRREKEPVIQFASIQSDSGKALLAWCGLPPDFSQAVVYIGNGKIYLGSSAALKIGQRLVFPWWILSRLGFMLPEFIRDWVYNQIAQNRYQWFGKRDVCLAPSEDLRSRFL